MLLLASATSATLAQAPKAHRSPPDSRFILEPHVSLRSFGDYFKKEAVEWGFEALTGGAFNLPADRFYATYFGGDEELGLPPDLETRDLWLNLLPAERVLPGNRKDNFWDCLLYTSPSPRD